MLPSGLLSYPDTFNTTPIIIPCQPHYNKKVLRLLNPFPCSSGKDLDVALFIRILFNTLI